MSDLPPNTVERLKGAAYEGDAVRELYKHPGFKIYLAALESMIADNKNLWLRGSDEDARNARLEARGVQRAIDELKKFIVLGDNSKRVLAEAALSDLSDLSPDLTGPADSK